LALGDYEDDCFGAVTLTLIKTIPMTIRIVAKKPKKYFLT